MELQEKVTRIDALIGGIESSADPAMQETVRELVDVLLEVHGAALEQVIDAVYGSGGQKAVDRLAEDSFLSSILVLHGLHPLDCETRVRLALEDVRPYLQSHGGNVELVGVTPEREVELRLLGTCNGCPSSSATLKYAVEQAIYTAAPEVGAIAVVEPDAEHGAGPDGFVPITDVMWDDCPFPESEEFV